MCVDWGPRGTIVVTIVAGGAPVRANDTDYEPKPSYHRSRVSVRDDLRNSQKFKFFFTIGRDI